MRWMELTPQDRLEAVAWAGFAIMILAGLAGVAIVIWCWKIWREW
jgi:hypothetical protein